MRVIIALSSNEGSGEPTHLHSRTRVFSLRKHSLSIDKD